MTTTFRNDRDVRLAEPTWDPSPRASVSALRLYGVVAISLVLVAWYLGWLLQPGRVGNPLLFVVLVVAEVFNVAQAIGFWWTCARAGERRGGDRSAADRLHRDADPSVDVFIPTYNEPVEIVEATVRAAMELRGADVRVAVLDDGNRDEMAAMARFHGARYVRRTLHQGAKAGNINHALERTDATYVLVLDCDHVPDPSFLERTLLRFDDPTVAFVQTPQYYANHESGQLAAAAWSQQALFFGPIARGKDARGAMFCCGTNVIFRREALEQVGGFPERSVTEDFELSIELHERGWTSAYVPEVLARGLGPEDLASYASQQFRWARGCVGALPRVARSTLPWRLRVQYLLSASYFLTGWTVLIYMSLPVIRIFTGAQPIDGASADTFLVHFAPYFGLAVLTVATVGAGTYTFAAYSLAASSFWIHVHASLKALTGNAGTFVVTPKEGALGRQWRPALPTLAALAVLVAASVYALAGDTDAATLNNVAFAALHIAVLSHGITPALAPRFASNRLPDVSDIDGSGRQFEGTEREGAGEVAGRTLTA